MLAHDLKNSIASFVAGLAVMGAAWGWLGHRPAAVAPAESLHSELAATRSPVLASRPTMELPPERRALSYDSTSSPSFASAVVEAPAPVDPPALAGAEDVSPGQAADPQPHAPAIPLLINVNTATARELELLPQIGPALAQRIIEERARGRFRSVRDLERVRGIGPRTVERLDGLVSFE
jgi:competence protein ComEA